MLVRAVLADGTEHIHYFGEANTLLVSGVFPLKRGWYSLLV